MKLSGPGLLFVWCFLIADLISKLVIGLFRLSISPRSSFGRLYISRKIFISSRLPICWQITVHSFLLWLYLCVICCDFSFYLSYFVFWVLSLFFLMSQAKGLLILCFPKKPNFWFHWSFLFFFLSLFYLFLLYLYYFLHALAFSILFLQYHLTIKQSPCSLQSTSLALSVPLTSAPSCYSSSHISLPHFLWSFSILFWALCPQLNPFPTSTLTIWPHFWKTKWPCQEPWPLNPKELWSKSHNSLCISHLLLAFCPHSYICHLITRLF